MGNQFTVSPFIPNPAVNESSLKITSQFENLADIKVYNSLGNIVDQKKIQLRKGLQFIPFDIQRYSSGVYTTIIHVNGQKTTRKLVISK